MAQVTALNTESAFGITGAATPYITDAKRRLFSINDVVFRLADLPAAGSGAAIPSKASIAWTVLEFPEKQLTSGGIPKYIDQSAAYATPATNDGATTRTYTGWNHTTSTPAATTSATTLSKPWFYRIQNSVGTILTVHEADITDQAAVETYVAANFAAMWP